MHVGAFVPFGSQEVSLNPDASVRAALTPGSVVRLHNRGNPETYLRFGGADVVAAPGDIALQAGTTSLFSVRPLAGQPGATHIAMWVATPALYECSIETGEMDAEPFAPLGSQNIIAAVGVSVSALLTPGSVVRVTNQDFVPIYVRLGGADVAAVVGDLMLPQFSCSFFSRRPVGGQASATHIAVICPNDGIVTNVATGEGGVGRSELSGAFS